MAKKTGEVNKSEEIRQLVKANPAIGAKEAIAILTEKGIKISNALFYYTKGQMKGRKARKTSDRKTTTRVSESTHLSRVDAVATILKVKECARQVGGMAKLKALVDVLSE